MLRFFAPQFPDYLPLAGFLEGCESVALLGATLGSLNSPTRPENAAHLRELAQVGVRMTFALVDPDAPPHVHTALADWFGATVSDVRLSLRETTRFLLRIRDEAGSNAEGISIRGLQVLPSSGVAMVDHETPAIRTRLTLYPMQGHPRYDPFLEGDRSSPDGHVLCDLCLGHFNRLLTVSRELTDVREET